MLFLIGAGVSGGAEFVKYFDAIYFLYGFIMTVLPMVIGFLIAKYVIKLPLLNNLGSITGGMTSTPALGTLIHVAKTGCRKRKFFTACFFITNCNFSFTHYF